MGLDLGEIIIAIENEFCIRFPDDPSFDLTIESMQAFARASYDPDRIREAIRALPPDAPDGRMPREAYAEVLERFSWMPSPGLLSDRRFRREDVERHLAGRLHYEGRPEGIDRMVVAIVRRELQLKVEPRPQDHLVHDLGAD